MKQAKTLSIKEEDLSGFLEELKKGFEVYDTRDDFRSGGLPFKKYLFPPKQEIFSKTKKGGVSASKAPEKFVVFGLNLPDLEALTYFDEIMKNPNEDFFYLQNRERAVVIGMIKEEGGGRGAGGRHYFSRHRWGAAQGLAKHRQREKIS
ncbi:MAG: hypothetical protein GXP44_02650 [bacterium]|nr:hypothetical protein [bacterium]